MRVRLLVFFFSPAGDNLEILQVPVQGNRVIRVAAFDVTRHPDLRKD